MRLSHDQPATVKVRVEVDLTGTGVWVPYAVLQVPAGGTLEHPFLPGFSAYWLRTVALGDAKATAQLAYR